MWGCYILYNYNSMHSGKDKIMETFKNVSGCRDGGERGKDE